MYSMPAFLQASISVALIGREASLMSVSPRQNFWKPPPVPEMPTVTRLPFSPFWNSSATASLIGKTVLEPSRVTSDGPDVDGVPPVRASCALCPQAARDVKSQSRRSSNDAAERRRTM